MALRRCPAGYAPLALAAPFDTGTALLHHAGFYELAHVIDQGGNADGWVCGHPLSRPDALAAMRAACGDSLGTPECPLDPKQKVYDLLDDTPR